jgi:hypothetical protein
MRLGFLLDLLRDKLIIYELLLTSVLFSTQISLPPLGKYILLNPFPFSTSSISNTAHSISNLYILISNLKKRHTKSAA